MALIFQYGSNTHEARINCIDRLNGDAKYLYNAKTIGEYEIDFTVWSSTNNCAAADMVRKKGSHVWGVVYCIPDYLVRRNSAKKRGRKSLDEIEGEGKNYRRTRIKVETESGEIISAITYIVKCKRKGFKTSLEYARHIIKGLEEHHIPNEYIQKVKQKIVENNSSLWCHFKSSSQ